MTIQEFQAIVLELGDEDYFGFAEVLSALTSAEGSNDGKRILTTAKSVVEGLVKTGRIEIFEADFIGNQFKKLPQIDALQVVANDEAWSSQDYAIATTGPAIAELFTFLDYERVIKERLSTFPDLVGYYETKDSGVDLTHSLDAFFDSFASRLPQGFGFSSLTEFAGHLDFWQESDHHLAKMLNEMGWWTFGKSAEEALRVFSQASLSSIPLPTLRKTCRLVFRSLTYGWLFFFWPDEGLVVYPHEKGGFGFVAKPNSAGREMALAFLSQLDPRQFNVMVPDRA